MAERPRADACVFAVDGAQRFEGAVIEWLPQIRAALADIPAARAGVRLHAIAPLVPFTHQEGPIGAFAAAMLGPECRPVRAILFDKTADMNWSLGWHQDRTICVRRRIDVAGFGPWTMKAGLQHVAPPFDILRRMITLRVHLDDVSPGNAPLLIARGSHREGLVPVRAYADVVRRSEIATCVAVAGDLWMYATPILHASHSASMPGRRRVLQIDYSADRLSDGLEWLGL